MNRRNSKHRMEYDNDDAHDQPSVDDLQVAAAAAAAAHDQSSEETSSSDESSSEYTDDGSESSMTDSDEPETSTLADDSIPHQERVNLSLAFDQNGAVKLTLLPQYQLSSREHLAAMIESSDDYTTDDDDDDMTSTSEDDNNYDVQLAYKELKSMIDDMYDDDGAIPNNKLAAEELFGSTQPTPLDITISDDDAITMAGTIMSIIEGTIVVRAHEGSQVLQEGSVLVLENKSIIGVVEDIFGPVQAPLYALRYSSSNNDCNKSNGGNHDTNDTNNNNTNTTNNNGVVAGVAVYSVDRLCDFVLPDDLRVKGYDDDDEGVDGGDDGQHPEMQFSDDEAEAEYKRKLKSKRKKERDTTDGKSPLRKGRRNNNTNESKQQSTRNNNHHHKNNNNNMNTTAVYYHPHQQHHPRVQYNTTTAHHPMPTMMPIQQPHQQQPQHMMPMMMMNQPPQPYPYPYQHQQQQQSAYFYPMGAPMMMMMPQQQQQQQPPPPPGGGAVPGSNGSNRQQMKAHATAGQFGAMSLQPHHAFIGKNGSNSTQGNQPPPPPPS